MDLLQDNKKKPTKTPAQNFVLFLLIVSIILCIIIGIIMVILNAKGETKQYSLIINETSVDLNNIQLITTENNTKYIPLKSICNILEYDYYNGEFKTTGEDKTKGYIDNNTNVIQFFADSKKIYKTSEKTNLDYEYYTLNHDIIFSNDNLYIALEDLDVALNLILNYSTEDNQTTIQTSEYWINQKSDTFKESNITISNTIENMKALSYGYIIISKEEKYGVINLEGEELIGNKYNNILFSEYTGDFIVSDTSNKFGVISKDGVAKINLQYDSLEIINYEPLLYKVERLEKYGVLNKNGKIINEIKYDSFGYPENRNKGINYTLVIPNLNENIPESIVVCANNKYGLLDLETGNEIISCDLDGIYSVSEDEKTYYIVETQNKKMFLENFIR